jgi:hypothetical protein
MHDTVMRILPWCLLFHCVFNIYAYSDKEIFPNYLVEVFDQSTQQSVYKAGDISFWIALSSEMGFPFFILLILKIVVWIIEIIVFRILGYF